MRLMKKLIVLLPLTFLLAHADMCQRRIEQLADLQQRLVTRTLKNLNPGAWARYEGGKAVYVGRQTQEGKTLYGIDVTLKKVPLQGWFTLQPKPLKTPSKTYRVPMLAPHTLYVKNGGSTLQFKEDQIRSAALLFGVDLGALFSPLPTLMPKDCRKLPTLRTLTYQVGKKRIKAYKIEDAKGRYAIVSEAVPFGVVELYDGKKQGVFLQAFAFKNGQPAITPAMRQKAIYLPISIRLSAR